VDWERANGNRCGWRSLYSELEEEDVGSMVTGIKSPLGVLHPRLPGAPRWDSNDWRVDRRETPERVMSEEEWRREVVVGDFDDAADVDRRKDDREEAATKQEEEAAEVAFILIVKSMAVIMAW